MSRQAEIQQQAIQRAREFADRRGFKGGGYEMEDYTKALSELSPEDREVERGLAPVEEDGNQAAAASRHFAGRVRHFTTQGYNHARAIELAKAEEGPGLRAVRAGLPPSGDGPPSDEDEGAAHFALMTGQRPGASTLKTHAVRSGPLSTIEHETLRTARPTLVRQVAADCLFRGRTQPDHHSWRWVDSWYGVNFPPPPPMAGSDNTQALDAYNQTREAFLDEVMEAARVILRDPQAANLLKPTPLGR